MPGRIKTTLVSAVVLASIYVTTVGAQQPAKSGWTQPRTAWGDPDLSGIWPSTDMVGVPFERPEAMGERTQVTEEEFVARQKQEQTRALALA